MNRWLNAIYRQPSKSSLRRTRRSSLTRPMSTIELLERRDMLADGDWTNVLVRGNVTGDAAGLISPLDALLVINEIDQPQVSDAETGKLREVGMDTASPPPFFDVDCDGYVSPVDAIRVINSLNGSTYSPGWRFSETGGLDAGRGRFESRGCEPLLVEGNSFVVTLERSFEIPTEPSALSISYDLLSFDTADTDSINDAFEIAVVDEDGNSLVRNFIPGRDALINFTEGHSPAFRGGVKLDGNQVTVGLAGIPIGVTAKLIVRLVNNDYDTSTTVRITDVSLIPSDLRAELPEGHLRSPARLSSDPLRLPDTSQSLTERFPQGRISVTQGQTFQPPPLGDPLALSPVVEWSKSSFSVNPSSSNVMVTPIVIDLDRDDEPEIIFSTFTSEPFFDQNGSNNVLRAVRGRDGSEVWSNSRTEHAVESFAGLAAGDIDGDGFPEIIAVHSATDGLIAFEHDGTFKWLSPPVQGSSKWGSPAIADLDQDSVPEIIMGATVVNSDGTIRWNGRDSGGTGIGSNVWGSLSIVADLDLDGYLDVVAGASAYHHDGTLFFNAPVPDGFPAVGNFDGDAYPEIVLVARGNLYVLEHNGQVSLGPIPIPGGGAGGAPTIADVDGDADPEIGVAGARAYTVFERDGSVKWQVPVSDASSNVTGSAVFDFDGDGRAEIVYGDEQFLRIYDGRSGDVLYARPKSSATTYEFPVVADVDADGHAEIVSVANNYAWGNEKGIIVIGDDSWVPTRQIWNQHAYHITNVNDDGTIPTREANSWEVYNNYRRNLQPTGTQLGPPIISVSSPTGQAAAGTTLVLSGTALAQGIRSDGTRNTLEFVFVNGSPVDALDAEGQFFHAITLRPGINHLTFSATDAVGQVVTAEIELLGHQQPSGEIDFSQFADTSGSFAGVYARTSFDNANSILYADLATRNDGTFESSIPLLVGVKNITEPSVRVIGADGISPDGTPYYDYTQLVTNGKLTPSASTQSLAIAFFNPDGRQFDYELIFFGKLNEAPAFTSLPDVEAVVGKPYRYDADAIDPDGDPLNFTLMEGPPLTSPGAAAFDSTTGLFTWTPTAQDIGNRVIVLRASDGRGGIAEQRYTLSVVAGMPNRPPVITSRPNVLAHITSPEGGNVVVANDEWPLSDIGFAAAPDTPQFVRNVAALFTGDKPGSFLAFSDNFSLSEQQLARTLREAGHQWTVTTALTPTLEVLSEFDGVFLAEDVIDNSVLIDYVRQGGNVYLAAGTGWNQTGDANAEAVAWSGFLNTFGLEFAPVYRSSGVIPIDESPSVLFENVTGLYQGLGQPIIDLDPTDKLGTIIARLGSDGLYAVYESQFAHGDTYQYLANAADPDGDELVYRLTVHPDNMSIHPVTGEIRWAPRADQQGNHHVTLTVSDGRGGVATQEFVICVKPDPENHDPVIVSQPTTEVHIGQSYHPQPSRTANPNGPWSSGWKPSGQIASAELHLFDTLVMNSGLNGWLSSSADSGVANFSFNDTADAISLPLIGTWAPGDVSLHPGSGGQSAVLRFVAPETGFYSIEAAFSLIDTGDTIGHVITKSGELFAGAAWNSPSFSTSTPVQLQVGDFVDFALDGQYTDGNTRVIAQITKLTDYQYEVEAIDPDNDALTYSLKQAPQGMSIARDTGRITWHLPPSSAPPFDATVVVVVDDGRGGNDEQSFTITATQGSGEIRGTKFNDLNGDGIFEKSGASPEPGLPGWTIFLDQNDNGRYDAGERTAITDVSGNFVFTGLHAGVYIVLEELRPGWRQTTPTDVGYIVTLGADQVANGLDFGSQLSGDLTNRNPIITSIPVRSTTVGELLLADVTSSDPDSDPISFDLPIAPNGMTIHPQLGSLVWQPTIAQIGTHSVVVRVRDDRGGVALQAFEISAEFPNTPPVFTSSPVHRAVVGFPYQYQVAAQDAESDQIAFGLSTPLVGATIDSATGILRWTPTGEQLGPQVISISAADGRGGTELQTFTVNVVATATNHTPVIKSTARTQTLIDQSYVYPVQAIDPDADPITYQLDNRPAGMTIDASGIVRWLPTTTQIATHTIQIRVTDGRGGSTVQTFDLEVTAQARNSAPLISSSPHLVALTDRPYRYDAHAFDADQDPVLWSLDEAPLGMSLDSATGAIRWTPREDQLGEQSVIVRALDPRLGTSIQQFTIDVRCHNFAPSIISVPLTRAIVGRTYLYAVRAQDDQDDSLTFSLQASPPEMSIDAQTGLIRWTPTTNQVGEHTVVIHAADSTGAIGTQSYSISASIGSDRIDPNDPMSPPLSNRPPLITSTPVFHATIDSVYQYQVVGVDPDGDTITFELSQRPDGMAIHPESGLINWTPATGQAGEQIVSVIVRDANNVGATQGFVVSVRANQPPTIRSTAPVSVTAGDNYRYDVRAIDPDGDGLIYTLDTAPNGMSIDGLGRIEWQTTVASMGTQAEVRVAVSDSHGERATQAFQISVSADTTRPVVSVVMLRDGVPVEGDLSVDGGSDVHLQVFASDNVAIERLMLAVNGVNMALNATGRTVLQNAPLGTLDVRATAIDVAGNIGESSISIPVIPPGTRTGNVPVPTDPSVPSHPGIFDQNDNRPPLVEISSPVLNDTVTDLTPIIATVDDPENNLWFYRVYGGRLDLVNIDSIDTTDPDWSVLGTGTTEVTNGELATFDPSNLTNDPYAIIVAAFDINGTGFIQPTIVMVEGNVQLGNFHLEFTDLSLPLAGIPIQITRVYDTLNAGIEGDFGFGWTLGVQDARILETVPAGTNFVINKTKVYLTNPEGRRVGFTFTPTCSGSIFGAICTSKFTPDAGVYDQLVGGVQFGASGILGALGGPFNPDSYTLVTKDGLRYDYSQFNGLQTITDLNGNVVRFTSTGIEHSSGTAIDFIRDHRGRIKEIHVPQLQGEPLILKYEYDATGDLRKFTNQIELTSRFDYRTRPAHYLHAAFDPLDRKSLEIRYDEGRYIGAYDVNGIQIDQQDFDSDAHTAIIRDANGNFTTLLYDDRGNVLEETDAVGKTLFREYNDPGNPDLETRIIDRNGNVTDYKYDARGNTTEITDSVGTRRFAYNTLNKVTRVTDELGRATGFEYDSVGNVTRIVNAVGDASSVTYDSQSRPTSYTDFRGFTTSFQYHGSSSQPSEIINPDDVFDDPARRSHRLLEYNTYGQTINSTDEEGIVTETQYDNAGRIVFQRTGQDAPVEYEYQGQLQTKRVVRRSLVEPGKSDVVTEFGYWPNDKLRFEIDALGAVTGYEYDANGNRTFLGRWDTKSEYDDDYLAAESNLNIVPGRYPRATFEHVFVYDSLNRVDYELDDVQLDLAEKSGIPLDQITVKLDYEYDAVGNRGKITDRNGRVRTFDYDERNRQTLEQWFASSSDTTPDRSFVWTYCTCGAVQEATEYAAEPFTSEILSRYLYTHDNLNRVTSVDNVGTKDMPHVILSYGYDDNGNRTSVTDNLGVAVMSTYDNRNRLDTRWWENTTDVHAIDEALVDFDYYRNGAEKELRRYSNKTATTLVSRTYHSDMDDSGRIKTISHRNAADAILAEYRYSFDKLGLVDGVSYDNATVERDGVADPYDFVVDYNYDDLGQLTDADYSDATTGRGIYEDEYYRYDRNGNRTDSYLHRKDLAADGRSYETGRGNQLQSDGVFDYVYDNEGNMVRKVNSTSGETTVFEYDHRNLMTRATIYNRAPEDGGLIIGELTNRYDIDGRRIAFSNDDDGDGANPTQETRVIHNGDDTWADFDTAGLAVTRYMLGARTDELIARFEPIDQNADIAWYLTDRLGTVRELTDALGMLGDQIIYDSSGGITSEIRVNAKDRFLFTGRELTLETGLYYYRSRYFDSSLGRFSAEDPLRFDAGDMNLYRYGGNSPLNATDPNGTLALLDRALLTGAAVLITAPLIRYFRGDNPLCGISDAIIAGTGVYFGSPLWASALFLYATFLYTCPPNRPNGGS